MAARRLLIVMLILLGLSTLAAALVPQHALRGGTTGSTTTQPAPTTTTPPASTGRSLSVEILVGGKKVPVPVVASPPCKKREPKCEPLHVGDQLSLQVLSKINAQLEIPAFGLLSVASRNAPALFQLLPQEPGTIGVLFASSGEVAARIQVLSAKAAAKAVRKPGNSKTSAKSRARGGSGRA
jgi:hypothetical protein